MALHFGLLVLHVALITLTVESFQSGFFNLVEDDHQLNIPVFREYLLQSTADCFQRCFSEKQCKSVNIRNELDVLQKQNGSGHTLTGIFLLRHVGSRCITLNQKSGTFLLSEVCGDHFAITSTKNLYHIGSGKCVKPIGTYNGAAIMITDTCDQNSEYTFTKRNSIEHVKSTKCIHPQDGYRYPSESTKIVLYKGCGEKRLQFFVEQKGFIQCQLLSSNKKSSSKSSFISKQHWSYYEPV